MIKLIVTNPYILFCHHNPEFSKNNLPILSLRGLLFQEVGRVPTNIDCRWLLGNNDDYIASLVRKYPLAKVIRRMQKE